MISVNNCMIKIEEVHREKYTSSSVRRASKCKMCCAKRRDGEHLWMQLRWDFSTSVQSISERIMEVERRRKPGREKTVLAVSRCQVSMSVLFYELQRSATFAFSLPPTFYPETTMHKAFFRSDVYNDWNENVQTLPPLMIRTMKTVRSRAKDSI